MESKDIYFYIDESGSLSGLNERFFLMTCMITEDPTQIKGVLEDLRNYICNAPYYVSYKDKFLQTGFHATENHPDIRAEVYKRLDAMNMRLYSIILDKSSDTYKDIRSRLITDDAIYLFLIKNLLSKRLVSERNNRLHIMLEEYGSKIMNHKNSMESIVKEIACYYRLNLIYELEVCSKDNIVLSVVDYVNYVLYQILNGTKNNTRMIDNFKLIQPKVALLHDLHNKQYYGRNKHISFEEILGRKEVN